MDPMMILVLLMSALLFSIVGRSTPPPTQMIVQIQPEEAPLTPPGLSGLFAFILFIVIVISLSQ